MADEEVEAFDHVEKKPVETGEEADAEIQTDKCVDPESDPQVETATVETAVDNMQTEKMDECAESDRVCFIDTDDDLTRLAKLLNKSEEWIEKRRQQHKENAARSKRIMDQFRADVINQGYLEEEEDDNEEEEDDEDFDANFARMQEINTRLWNEHCLACSSK